MKPLCDVRVINEYGVWITDTVARRHQAIERARFLLPRVTAVEVRNQKTWERVSVL